MRRMNTGPSLVSVIVPTRNSSRTLEACLLSIRAQNYQPIELVVIDNDSTDHTLQIANRHADIVETFGTERSAQRNRGARLAHGDHLLFIDSDMRLESGVVSDCMETIRCTEAPGVIIPEVSIGEGFLAQCRAFERSCYHGDDSVEGARFLPRTVFEVVGGFDENLVAMEDWDLTLRVSAGAALPRTRSFISHDDGRLRLASMLAKKRYYAASAEYYLRKHHRRALSQANIIFRPAFLRHWPRLVRHPILTAGFLSLKWLEAGAVVIGVLESRLRGPDVTRPSDRGFGE
jgi:glycosyltransferase involved in cell wall biosynthesis